MKVGEVMNEVDKIAVGRRIKDIRVALGLSMEEFGKKLDTSKGAVNNWEKGKNLPNTSRLSAICNLGNTTLEKLLYGSLSESLIFLMTYAENYPGIWDTPWVDFFKENEGKMNHLFLENMYDYIAWKKVISTSFKFPLHLFQKKKSELSDSEKIEIDNYLEKVENEKDGRIFKYALEYSTTSNINLSDRLMLMGSLSIAARRVAEGHEFNDVGFVKKALDETENLYGEVEGFIYLYDFDDQGRNRTDKISHEIEQKVLPRISELKDYFENLLSSITKESDH
ncbi:helix-turn-helix domain-containing protein [Enterococcus xiangfangensis]|uniref:helix-turn-helix domain-containing protein n=2 Tax=Enterococcus TaxID=1350 RepID=UPI003D17B4CA